MNYDPKVYELIKHFLEAVPEKNTERNRQLLARHDDSGPSRRGGKRIVGRVAASRIGNPSPVH